MHSIALFAAAVLAYLALNARLGAMSSGVHIPQCPTVASLQELPDMQACRQVLAMAQDPRQGCAALGPFLPIPDTPAGGYVRKCDLCGCSTVVEICQIGLPMWNDTGYCTPRCLIFRGLIQSCSPLLLTGAGAYCSLANLHVRRTAGSRTDSSAALQRSCS